MRPYIVLELFSRSGPLRNGGEVGKSDCENVCVFSSVSKTLPGVIFFDLGVHFWCLFGASGGTLRGG